MIVLVTGGSGSGKSEYAEDYITSHSGKNASGLLVYIATMKPYTEETLQKIERHHRLREGKGFTTIEKYTGLQELEVPANRGILLECMSNLIANELYREDGTENPLEEVEEKVVAGVQRLMSDTGLLVIVTNEVNGDVNGYSEATENYRKCIGAVNRRLAEMADVVTEVVYGIPVCVKGKTDEKMEKDVE